MAENKFKLLQPPFAPKQWAVYLVDKVCWCGLEDTPEKMLAIWGGYPENAKELKKLGHLKYLIGKALTVKQALIAASNCTDVIYRDEDDVADKTTCVVTRITKNQFGQYTINGVEYDLDNMKGGERLKGITDNGNFSINHLIKI